MQPFQYFTSYRFISKHLQLQMFSCSLPPTFYDDILMHFPIAFSLKWKFRYSQNSQNFVIFENMETRIATWSSPCKLVHASFMPEPSFWTLNWGFVRNEYKCFYTVHVIWLLLCNLNTSFATKKNKFKKILLLHASAFIPLPCLSFLDRFSRLWTGNLLGAIKFLKHLGIYYTHYMWAYHT